MPLKEPAMMKKLIALAFFAAFGLTSFSALAEEDHHHHYYHHHYYHHHDHHMWRTRSGRAPKVLPDAQPHKLIDATGDGFDVENGGKSGVRLRNA
jgi:hypothetical protein